MPAVKSDKREQSLFFPEEMLDQIKREANRQDRSLSWIVQRAWTLAHNFIGVDDKPNARSVHASAKGRMSEKSPTLVLVVDDDQRTRNIYSLLLESMEGIEIVVASDAKVALQLAEERRPDVIISDIVMPGMNGLDLLRAIRSFDPDVPVVLLTGTPTFETARRAVELGAFHYLTKPVDRGELHTVVKQANFAHRMAKVKRRALELAGVGEEHPGDLAGLDDALSSALDSLWMAYQPIVRADNGEVFGYEALMRSTEARLPHPGAVLDAAEKLNRLNDLGRKIRTLAVAPMGAVPEAHLFVNLHPADLLDPDLLSHDAPLSQIADRVVLEVTERASLQRVPEVESTVAGLKDMGFQVAIDDLGVGYAGLTSFATLEPQVVKLDITLVCNIDSSQTKRRLVRSVVEACSDLGILVVAEGIETVEEGDTCIELGCDLLQGYLIARPDRAFPKIRW
jgi:uncharacterized small protein (TIGR04563 family)